jgi:hypothetical protein
MTSSKPRKPKPRKPRGIMWGGVIWQVDMLQVHDYKNRRKLQQLHNWLTKALAWAETK